MEFFLGVFLEPFSFLFGDVMHGLSEVADVGGGDSGHGDATVLGEVNAVVGDYLLDLKQVIEHFRLVQS